jgi:L-asparaginase
MHRKARNIAGMLGMAVAVFSFGPIVAEVMSAEAGRPRIMFITTGGTIAHRENPDGSNSRIELPEVIANIRARYPQPDVSAFFESIQPSFKEVTLVGSSSLRLQDFLNITWETQKALDQNFDAAIVTHGTTTSEDTCYFLNLLVNSKKPIVVTNSQRQHLSVGNEGDRNLMDAIMVATHRNSVGKGALLVEGAKIVACREVLKNSDRPGAFLAQNLGVLGWLAGGTFSLEQREAVTFYREPVRKHTFNSELSIKDIVNPDGTFQPVPRVEVLPSYYDAKPDVVDALVNLGVQGFVIHGLAPSGSVFRDQQARLTELAKQGMPIVQTTRNAASYDAPVRARPPFIGGDDLPSHKARILLQLAMKKTEQLKGSARLDKIQQLFSTH